MACIYRCLLLLFGQGVGAVVDGNTEFYITCHAIEAPKSRRTKGVPRMVHRVILKIRQSGLGLSKQSQQTKVAQIARSQSDFGLRIRKSPYN